MDEELGQTFEKGDKVTRVDYLYLKNGFGTDAQFVMPNYRVYTEYSKRVGEPPNQHLQCYKCIIIYHATREDAMNHYLGELEKCQSG